MSDIELIEKFLSEFESQNAVIYKDGSRYAVQVDGIYSNGATLMDALRNFYAQDESEKSE